MSFIDPKHLAQSVHYSNDVRQAWIGLVGVAIGAILAVVLIILAIK